MDTAAQKSFQIQSQIRHNAEEFKNTLNELYSWEKEIKDKEQKLQRQPPEEATASAGAAKKQHSTETPPPVRSHVLRESNKKSAQTALPASPKHQQPQQPQDNKKAKVPTEKAKMIKEPNEKRKQANASKERGNNLVKLGQYVKAIDEYTAAIDAFPEDAAFYTNRALCYLKLKLYYECIKDCESALDIDIRCLKAYYRRMQANDLLGNDFDAYKDCQAILLLDPKNVEARKSLERINEKLRENIKTETGPNFRPVRSDMCAIEAVDKAPHERSSKPLRRIPVTDVVGPKQIKNEESPSALVSDDVIDKLFNSDCGPIVEVKEKRKEEQQKQKQATSNKVETEKVSSPQELPIKAPVKHHTAEVAAKNERNSENQSATKELKTLMPVKKAPSLPVDVKSKPIENTAKEKQSVTAASVSTPAAPAHATTANRPLPEAPTSTAQFYSNWKELTAPQKYQYLKSINISKLCKILGAGFDSDTLTEVIHTLHDYYMPQKDPSLAATLLEVSRNSQVSILSLLMSADERAALSEILHSLKEGRHGGSVAALIAKNFNLK